MKNYLKLLVCLFISINGFSQAPAKVYKQNFSGADKKIIIASGSSNLTIEGTTGTEVIIESDRSESEFPAEAEGLKIVSVGAVDNTGMGANVVIEGNTMKIKIPKSKYFGNFTLKIPKEISISVRESGNAYGKWQISGMKGEIEAETSYSTMNIKNVSGPIVARSGYGKIYIVYDQLNQSKPNSISAVGAIDITLPADTKANLKLHTNNAEVFTDFDIQPAKNDEKKEKGMGEVNEVNVQNSAIIATTAPTAKTITGVSDEAMWAKQMAWADARKPSNDGSTIGVLNGGGVSLSIKSDYGNIYLRKKK